jgi:hypothetical protein
VLGVSAPLPQAALHAPSVCEARAYTVTVTGSPVTTVTFYVNGRRVRRIASRSGQQRFTVRLPISARVMHVAARVVFTQGATPEARTLRATIRRCPKPHVKPQFTG